MFGKVVVPVIKSGTKSRTITEKQRSNLDTTEMTFLLKIDNEIFTNRIRNGMFREKLTRKPTTYLTEEKHPTRFNYVKTICEDRITR